MLKQKTMYLCPVILRTCPATDCHHREPHERDIVKKSQKGDFTRDCCQAVHGVDGSCPECVKAP